MSACSLVGTRIYACACTHSVLFCHSWSAPYLLGYTPGSWVSECVLVLRVQRQHLFVGFAPGPHVSHSHFSHFPSPVSQPLRTGPEASAGCRPLSPFDVTVMCHPGSQRNRPPNRLCVYFRIVLPYILKEPHHSHLYWPCHSVPELHRTPHPCP